MWTGMSSRWLHLDCLRTDLLTGPIMSCGLDIHSHSTKSLLHLLDIRVCLFISLMKHSDVTKYYHSINLYSSSV